MRLHETLGAIAVGGLIGYTGYYMRYPHNTFDIQVDEFMQAINDIISTDVKYKHAVAVDFPRTRIFQDGKIVSSPKFNHPNKNLMIMCTQTPLNIMYMWILKNKSRSSNWMLRHVNGNDCIIIGNTLTRTVNFEWINTNDPITVGKRITAKLFIKWDDNNHIITVKYKID
uniref:Uncharacterized protein n=1 Tax=Megaviridae environmental sample TaxID=1737588 RepID=A0A5J6VJG4_9VIRU|nr:MAG: hypothetical protein [Megaviridae environmental sample]